MKTILLSLLAVVVGTPNPVAGEKALAPIIISGKCLPPSMVGSGSSKAFLDRNGTPFLCDTAVMTDLPNGRTMMQFLRKRDRRGTLIGFGGIIPHGKKQMVVDHLYLNDGRMLKVTTGKCEFAIARGEVIHATCGARVERGDIAIGAVVVFDAS